MKYPSGFVPVDFQLLGKLLFGLGIAALLVKGVSYVTGWISLPNVVAFLGFAFILLGLYLIYVVPKPE